MEGDLALENIGLSKEDIGLLTEEISVVIHMAATLRLEAALKDAVIQNTLGTKRVLELCKQMKEIKVRCYYLFLMFGLFTFVTQIIYSNVRHVRVKVRTNTR